MRMNLPVLPVAASVTIEAACILLFAFEMWLKAFYMSSKAPVTYQLLLSYTYMAQGLLHVDQGATPARLPLRSHYTSIANPLPQARCARVCCMRVS